MFPPHQGRTKRIRIDVVGEQVDDRAMTKRFPADNLQDEDRDIQQNDGADG